MENFILWVMLCFMGGRSWGFLTSTLKAELHTFPQGAWSPPVTMAGGGWKVAGSICHFRPWRVWCVGNTGEVSHRWPSLQFLRRKTTCRSWGEPWSGQLQFQETWAGLPHGSLCKQTRWGNQVGSISLCSPPIPERPFLPDSNVCTLPLWFLLFFFFL